MNKVEEGAPPIRHRISFLVEVEVVHGSFGGIVNVSEVEHSAHYNAASDHVDEKAARIEYLHRYLANELWEVANQFTLHEWAVFQMYCIGDDAGAKSRKFVIQEILKRTDARLRKRLPNKGGGRPRSEGSATRVIEKRIFAEQCFDALSKIQERGEELSKINLAKELFSSQRITNLEKALRHRLKRFNLSFDQLIGSFNGQRAERVSLIEDKLEQIDRIMKCRYFED